MFYFTLDRIFTLLSFFSLGTWLLNAIIVGFIYVVLGLGFGIQQQMPIE